MARLHGHCTVSLCLLTTLLMSTLTGVQSAAEPFNETLLGTVSTFINVSGIPSKHTSCSVLSVAVHFAHICTCHPDPRVLTLPCTALPIVAAMSACERIQYV